MKANPFVKRLAGLATLVMAGGHSPVFACAACFGRTDSNMAQGMNFGIFALLLVVVCVLAGIASFFVHIARRTAAVSESAMQDFGHEFIENAEHTRP